MMEARWYSVDGRLVVSAVKPDGAVLATDEQRQEYSLVRDERRRPFNEYLKEEQDFDEELLRKWVLQIEDEEVRI
jgi:hypothetical protein